MKPNEKRRPRGSKPPTWILDELSRDPELLGIVVGIVRKFAKRSPAEKIPRRWIQRD